jgi:hypothetical protein
MLRTHRLLLACAVFLAAAGTRAQNLVDVIEFYNAGLDHYFISALAPDIEALDSGKFPGWARTGLSFKVYDGPAAGASPVCRFYIPPAQGDSHFYSASPTECADVRAKFPTFDYESASVMYVALPDASSGACASGLAPVYRLWNQRADSNHRYTTDVGARASMIARGYQPEGYGPNGVAMCAVPVVSFDVALSADSVLLMPGGSRDVYVSVTPHGGSAGAISLAVAGLPPGVAPQLSNASIDVADRAVSTLLKLTAADAAPPTAGKSSVTVSATDAGGRVVSATLAIGVAAAGDPLAARMAAIAAVEARSIEISAQKPTPVAFAQSIAAFMATRPEYVASGVDAETLSAWGRFADGSGHVVTSNRIPAPDASLSARDRVRPKSDGSELPQSSKARLLQSFGGSFDRSVAASSEMYSYLSSKGWSVTSAPSAEVANLQAVRGDGFFYLNTHGARVDVNDASEPDSKIYAVQSSTVVNDGLETAFEDELRSLRLVHFTAPQSNLQIPTAPGAPPVDIPLLFDTRYGITYRFVQKYMSFAPNSVIWMNACFSGRNQRFISSFLAKGAGVYFGWSESLSMDAAFKSAPYFVDRMLGANKHAPQESPPQRAFPHDLVLQDMATKSLDQDPANHGTLSATVGQSSFPVIFAPSIRRVYVRETDGVLRLQGYFTSDQSEVPKVTVGGAGIAVTNWSADEITAQLPGPTTSGDVVVEIRGVRSNARQLTQWSIPVTYKWDPALLDGFKMQGNGTIRLRGDIAGYRVKPGGSLTYLYTGGFSTKDSNLQVTGSGTHNDGGGCTSTLSGTRNFVSLLSGGIPTNILDAQFGIDASTRQGALSILVAATDLSGFFVQTYAGNCTTPPDRFAIAVGVQDGAVTVPSDGSDNPQMMSLPQGIKLQLDASYAITAVNRPSLPAPGVTGGGMVTYSWAAVAATAPPRDTPDSGK